MAAAEVPPGPITRAQALARNSDSIPDSMLSHWWLLSRVGPDVISFLKGPFGCCIDTGLKRG